MSGGSGSHRPMSVSLGIEPRSPTRDFAPSHGRTKTYPSFFLEEQVAFEIRAK